jgi:hypothetical protein
VAEQVLDINLTRLILDRPRRKRVPESVRIGMDTALRAKP